MRAPSDTTDSAEIAALEKRLNHAASKLASLVPSVAGGRQVREYDSDRRKAALARAMTPFLSEGESATASEAKGRASFNYTEEMKALAAQLKAAEHVIASWEAAKCEFEAARSLLSLTKSLSTL